MTELSLEAKQEMLDRIWSDGNMGLRKVAFAMSGPIDFQVEKICKQRGIAKTEIPAWLQTYCIVKINELAYGTKDYMDLTSVPVPTVRKDLTFRRPSFDELDKLASEIATELVDGKIKVEEAKC